MMTMNLIQATRQTPQNLSLPSPPHDHLIYLAFVTVEDPPISFSPFSLVDCTMLSHFLFNDFVAIAFLDLAGDLDAQT